MTRVKLAAALIGAILFGYGMRVDDPTIRWVGIGFFAAAAILRFASRRPSSPDADAETRHDA